MNKIYEALTSAFNDVEQVVQGRVRLEDGFSGNMELAIDSRMRHSYACTTCEMIRADIEKVRIKHIVDAERLGPDNAASEKVSARDFKALLLQRIGASPLFGNFGEDGIFIKDVVTELIASMPECDVSELITCRECGNGQQCGERGVVCKYTQDEYLPYDHFCARGERRIFGDEDNEE